MLQLLDETQYVVAGVQVSQSGGYVSTVDKHTVHVWSTQHPEWPSLKLHSTKALTVSHSTSHVQTAHLTLAVALTDDEGPFPISCAIHGVLPLGPLLYVVAILLW